MPRTLIPRSTLRAMAAEFPVGDPFGGAAYGERLDPGVALVASAGIQMGGSLLGSALADDYGAKGANDAAAASSRQQMAITGDMWDFYKAHYRPIEKQMLGEAADIGGDVDQEQAAARASSSVSAGYDAANKNARQSMLAMGVRPDSPAFQDAVVRGELARGADTARAGNDARESTKWAGREWRKGLVDSGRGTPSQVLNSYGAITAQQTQRAQWGANMQRQSAQDIGYLFQPAAKAASDWFKSSKWGGTARSGGSSFGGSSSGEDLMLAEGGEVQGFGVTRPDGSVDISGPGVVRGPGTGTSDSIPAQTDTGQRVQLSNGEYVIPAAVVRAKGTEFFDRVVKSVTEPKRSVQ